MRFAAARLFLRPEIQPLIESPIATEPPLRRAPRPIISNSRGVCKNHFHLRDLDQFPSDLERCSEGSDVAFRGITGIQSLSPPRIAEYDSGAIGFAGTIHLRDKFLQRPARACQMQHAAQISGYCAAPLLRGFRKSFNIQVAVSGIERERERALGEIQSCCALLGAAGMLRGKIRNFHLPVMEVNGCLDIFERDPAVTQRVCPQDSANLERLQYRTELCIQRCRSRSFILAEAKE